MNEYSDDSESKVVLCGKQRLIQLQCRHKPRGKNPFILNEAVEDNESSGDYYENYSPDSDSDSYPKLKKGIALYLQIQRIKFLYHQTGA